MSAKKTKKKNINKKPKNLPVSKKSGVQSKKSSRIKSLIVYLNKDNLSFEIETGPVWNITKLNLQEIVDDAFSPAKAAKVKKVLNLLGAKGITVNIKTVGQLDAKKVINNILSSPLAVNLLGANLSGLFTKKL